MILKMRGLPFDCTEEQINNFFTVNCTSPGIIKNGIIFIYKFDGKPSGDAFVIFESIHSYERAFLRHKQCIGTRYIELFKSTYIELEKYLRNKNIINSDYKKDCIRLRGLPFEAKIPHIIEFLGVYINLVQEHGIHMILNHKGESSGEVLIQLTSEEAAHEIASKLHNNYMKVGRKKRYIEIFQISSKDMNLISVPQNYTLNQQFFIPNTQYQNIIFPIFSAPPLYY
uniref:RRM domain-containing protein n=1 Tax=Parastrongyloides trichosuri TaxID=131310 RepID=A0A0N4ZKM7_PARTI